MKKSEIKINVEVDENHVPEHIQWQAPDGGVATATAHAMMLAFWDPSEQNTMKMDLWTKEMKVDEMKQFFHQTLLTMADSFEKATGEHLICEDMRDFCRYFAEKMDILPNES